MLLTTLRRAKEAEACTKSYKKMARALEGIKRYGYAHGETTKEELLVAAYAAYAATTDTARKWQEKRLLELLKGAYE